MEKVANKLLKRLFLPIVVVTLLVACIPSSPPVIIEQTVIVEVERIITATPMATDTPQPLPTSTLIPQGVGYVYSDDRVDLELRDAVFNATLWNRGGFCGDEAALVLRFRFTNRTNQKILLRYENADFTLIDNNEREYLHIRHSRTCGGANTAGYSWSLDIEAWEDHDFNLGFGKPGDFGRDVTFVTVSTEGFASLTNLSWRIDIPG